MLYEKAQKEIFTALAKGNRVCGCTNKNGDYIVTTDGIIAFVIPVAIIAFNVIRVPIVESMEQLFVPCTPEYEIQITPFTRKGPFRRDTSIRIFDNHGDHVYVNEKFLVYWHNPTFYQEKGKLDAAITVAETMYNEKSKETKQMPVGLILPMRCSFSETIREVDKGG